MNFNNFTIKSQEAIQKAFELTKGNGNQAIEPVHLLKGVIEEGESLVKFIFAKVGANLPALNQQLEREIASLPATNTSLSRPCLWLSSKSILPLPPS